MQTITILVTLRKCLTVVRRDVKVTVIATHRLYFYLEENIVDTAVANMEPERPENPVPENHIEAVEWYKKEQRAALNRIVNTVAAATFK